MRAKLLFTLSTVAIAAAVFYFSSAQKISNPEIYNTGVVAEKSQTGPVAQEVLAGTNTPVMRAPSYQSTNQNQIHAGGRNLGNGANKRHDGRYPGKSSAGVQCT